jgi:cytochrome P450
VPVSDRPLFEEWTPAAIRVLDPSEDFTVLMEAQEAVRHFIDYFRTLIAERRRSPGDDLLSAMLAAEHDGERLTEQDLLSTCVLLLIAGHETTVNLIGNGVMALLQWPDELRRLYRDPGLVGPAVEELLRYDSPVQVTSRTAVQDMPLGDGEFVVAKGEQVITVLAAANRDPAMFADPDRLDVSRNDRNHVAFGGGIHVCLGAPLARLEGRCALTGLLARWPRGLELAAEPERKESITLRGLASLRVRPAR